MKRDPSEPLVVKVKHRFVPPDSDRVEDLVQQSGLGVDRVIHRLALHGLKAWGPEQTSALREQGVSARDAADREARTVLEAAASPPLPRPELERWRG